MSNTSKPATKAKQISNQKKDLTSFSSDLDIVYVEDTVDETNYSNENKMAPRTMKCSRFTDEYLTSGAGAPVGHNLIAINSPRTHQDTQQQIWNQSSKGWPSSPPRYIHPYSNWAWDFKYINIHESQTLDSRHNLFKGVLAKLNDWTLNAIFTDQMGSTQKYSERGMERTATILDNRFAQIPSFTGLQTLAQQLYAAVTPLISFNVNFLKFIKALLDLTCIFQRQIITGPMNRAITRYLTISNQKKDHLLDIIELRMKPESGKRGTSKYRAFNFPKFHAMAHYPAQIALFGSMDGYTTDTTEALHQIRVLRPYKNTNRRGWEAQITGFNTRDVKVRAYGEYLKI
ncbi:hypothetical protein TWF694_009234 [Orbilia ellipsospora]|uniref:Capsid protein n=1 Tax=Orbilia ellipsospora TaxID=2528407 RepID=A0AAV9XEZ3_9PEZI